MNTIKSAFEIAYKTYQKDIPLRLSLRNYFNAHASTPEHRKIVKRICANFFRNYLALYELIEDAFPKLRMNDFYILGVALSDCVFIKSVTLEENLVIVFDLLRNNKSSVSNDMVERLFNNITKYVDFIPSTIKPESKKYMSLKYNIPLWLVELWSKHYGKSIAQKLMLNTRKFIYQNFRVNRLKTTSKQLVTDYASDFIMGRSLTGTTVVYKSIADWKLLSNYQRGEIIPITEGMNHLVNKLSLRNNDDILVIDYANLNVHLALAEASKDKANITLYRQSEDASYSAMNYIRQFGFNRIETAGGPLSRLFTFISNKKDIVVLCPKSTNFNEINHYPDFFIHNHQEDIDKHILGQKEMLEEGSNYVMDNGLLVYAIETANNKEGSLLIKEFLDSHSEFKLVEQRQTLQFDRRATSIYFAILRKIGK